MLEDALHDAAAVGVARHGHEPGAQRDLARQQRRAPRGARAARAHARQLLQCPHHKQC